MLSTDRCLLYIGQNTGDVACPSSVPVLRAEEVEQQLNEAAACFLKKQLLVDTARRVVVLPKVCDVYNATGLLGSYPGT